MKPFYFLAVMGVLLTGCSVQSEANDGESKPLLKQVIIPAALQSTYDDLQYAPAVRAGDFVYLSGVVVMLNDDETLDDIKPAAERAFAEIEMVMKEAGIDWSHVVDVTSYMTDLDNQLLPFWDVKTIHVPAPYPAWTAIGVDRLYGGQKALIEIKVTAYAPKE